MAPTYISKRLAPLDKPVEHGFDGPALLVGLGAVMTGRLVKPGTGTLTLSGNNTYVGLMDVNAGTLLVNGTHSGGTYTVGSGATPGGTGTLGAMVPLAGEMSPGNSVGKSSLAAKPGATGAAFTFEVEDATGLLGPAKWCARVEVDMNLTRRLLQRGVVQSRVGVGRASRSRLQAAMVLGEKE